jgi:hypothetical protein
MIEVQTKVFQDKTLQFLFTQAPEMYRKTILSWLIRERGKFVGDSHKLGSFSKSILRKKHSGRDGTWSSKVAKAFKGYITPQNRIEGMTLTMGIGLNHGSGFTEAIAKMEDGYLQHTSKSMIIPNYKGLQDSFIAKSPYKAFRDMMEEEKLEIINKNGRVYYFEKGINGRLLFFGAKSITVKKQINFTESWQKQLPSVLNNGQKAVDVSTQKLANGIYS